MVENLLTPEAKVAFVLESPHIDEVFHGYPACGKTGREMSKLLLGRYDVPLGLVVKFPDLTNLLRLPTTAKFSLLNVSKRPLQETAYSQNGLSSPQEIELMMTLKRYIEKGDADLETRHRDEGLIKFRDNLYAEFEQNCKEVLGDYSLVIPCGKFAETFVTKVAKRLKFSVMNGIPHPQDGWSDLDETTQVQLRSAIGL